MTNRPKCKFCNGTAKYRVWAGYHGYEYYCKECAEKQTIGGKI